LKHSRMGFSRSFWLGLTAISIVAIVGSIVVAENYVAAGLPPHASPFSNQTAATVSENDNSSSASSLGSNGILLNATISPISPQSGENLKVSIEVFNTLFSTNNISANLDWAFPSLIGICPDTGFVNFVVYQGHYVPANLSSATPLPSNAPGEAACGPPSRVGYFVFSERSDLVTAVLNASSLNTSTTSSASSPEQISQSCSLYDNETTTLSDGNATTIYLSSSCTSSTVTYVSTSSPRIIANNSLYSFNATGSFSINNYYDASISNFTDFSSGQYSLLVGDIWDNYVILYFTVA
jgi:hypothetical protein